MKKEAPAAGDATAPVRRSKVSRKSLVVMVGDLGMIGVALAIAYLLRTPFAGAADLADHLAIVSAPLSAVWLLALSFFGAYVTKNLGTGPRESHRVLQASASTAFMVGVLCYLTEFQLSRAFFVGVFCSGTPLLLLARLIVRRSLYAARRRGRLVMRTLVVGAASHIDDIVQVLRRETWLGYEVVGGLIPESARGTRMPSSVRVLGRTHAALAAVSRHKIDVVIFAAGAFDRAADFRRMAWGFERSRVEMIVVPSLVDLSPHLTQLRPIAGLPLVYVDQSQRHVIKQRVKRIFVRIGAGLLNRTHPDDR